jgi:hypothetical protein
MQTAQVVTVIVPFMARWTPQRFPVILTMKAGPFGVGEGAGGAPLMLPQARSKRVEVKAPTTNAMYLERFPLRIIPPPQLSSVMRRAYFYPSLFY